MDGPPFWPLTGCEMPQHETDTAARGRAVKPKRRSRKKGRRNRGTSSSNQSAEASFEQALESLRFEQHMAAIFAHLTTYVINAFSAEKRPDILIENPDGSAVTPDPTALLTVRNQLDWAAAAAQKRAKRILNVSVTDLPKPSTPNLGQGDTKSRFDDDCDISPQAAANVRGAKTGSFLKPNE